MRIKLPFIEIELNREEIGLILGTHLNSNENDESKMEDYIVNLPVMIMGKLNNAFQNWIVKNILIISFIMFLIVLVFKACCHNLIPDSFAWINGIMDSLLIIFLILMVISIITYLIFAILIGISKAYKIFKDKISKQSAKKERNKTLP